MNELGFSDDLLEKAKYIKREGTAGHYTYTYAEGGGKKGKQQEKEVNKRTTVKEVEEEGLKEGFSDREFEKYVNDNKNSIRSNMETYGVKKKELKDVDNYYDVANILGVDSNYVKNIDHGYYMNFLKELL